MIENKRLGREIIVFFKETIDAVGIQQNGVKKVIHQSSCYHKMLDLAFYVHLFGINF